MLSCYDAQGNHVWADSIHVGDIGKNISYGRYPNGSDDLYVMNRMTFGDANFYSPYNDPVRFTADESSPVRRLKQAALRLDSFTSMTSPTRTR